MDLTEVTNQTLDALKKAATSGFTSSTGVTAFDLSDLVSLVPVNTPFRDRLARTTPTDGAKNAQWRALLNMNSSQPDFGTAFDYAGALAVVSELDVSAPYAKIAAGWTATADAQTFAKGYADVKAKAIWNAMNQFKIAEDRKAVGGQRFALQTPGTPTGVQSDTGGSIAGSTTVYFKVAARTATNFYNGGSTVASTGGSTATGAAATASHSVTASVAAVRGAVAYDWYVGAAASPLYYATTTTTNKLVITSITTSNQAVPGGLPGLYTTAPTAVPTVDSSAKANDFNGLLATLAGDYNDAGFGLITPGGSGVTSGAYFASLDGSAFSISGANIAELDALNQSIYDSVQQSPDVYMVSSREGAKISNAMLASSGAGTTFFQPNLAGRDSAVLGAFVGFYVNKAAGGQPVALEVNPNVPPGTLIARTDQVSFPDSGIGRVTEMRTQQDVTNWDYPSGRASGAGGGPRWDGEVFALETLVNYAPATMGVLSNIG
jgi:hypothetical protein